MELIDTHCHLTFEELAEDVQAVVERSIAAGVVGWLTVGTDPQENRKAIELANKFENMASYNLALGNRDGRIHFSNLKKDDRNAVVQDANGVEVTLARLDDIGITDDHIDLLKIDVEGYEKFVMEGAADILSRTRCVYFESHDVSFAEFDYTPADLLRILIDQGFAIYRIQDDMVTTVPEDHQSPVCENLIAVRNLDEFLSRTKLSLT